MRVSFGEPESERHQSTAMEPSEKNLHFEGNRGWHCSGQGGESGGDRDQRRRSQGARRQNAGARSLPQFAVQPIYASLAKLEHLLYKKCTRRGNQNPNQNQSICVSASEYLRTAAGREEKEGEATDSKQIPKTMASNRTNWHTLNNLVFPRK